MSTRIIQDIDYDGMHLLRIIDAKGGAVQRSETVATDEGWCSSRTRRVRQTKGPRTGDSWIHPGALVGDFKNKTKAGKRFELMVMDDNLFADVDANVAAAILAHAGDF